MTPAEAATEMTYERLARIPASFAWLEQRELNALAMHPRAWVSAYNLKAPIVAEVTAEFEDGRLLIARRKPTPVPPTVYEYRGLDCEKHGQVAHRRPREGTGFDWKCCECEAAT